jgi:hypothetical protein
MIAVDTQPAAQFLRQCQCAALVDIDYFYHDFSISSIQFFCKRCFPGLSSSSAQKNFNDTSLDRVNNVRVRI